jgi:hypothetical protein
MGTHISVLIFVVTTLIGADAHAQIIRDMSPERIREAIAVGSKAKNVWVYTIQEKARWSWPPLLAVYTTPFLRVALAANAAKKQYKTFAETDVTPDMLKPEIQVFIPSRALQGTSIANVQTIVLLPHNSKDAAQAVHPTSVTEATQEYKNLLGFTGEGKGMVAVFPIDAWREDYDAHVVFDAEIPSSQGPGAVGGCMDCRSRLYLKDVK